MNNVLQTLKERGFIAQCTDLTALSNLMNEGPISLYLGIDPTYHSLHIGHLTPVFMMRHFYNAGHHVIPLMGGGTGRIGDPSGKTEMRKMLSYADIDHNVDSIKLQLSGLLDFTSKRVNLSNNADWLANLNYIDFLRDIGSHFSVNKMLSYEAYKKRMESGLSFIEFNYQILQSYDFYILNKTLNARLQIGGDDQWGNITAGTDLIRRMGGSHSFGLTCPLITRSDGAKMGKSEKGAIFLDKNITSPYQMFQYWRNIADADVGRFLALYTFLPMEEVNDLSSVKDEALNASKERLAYEYVKIIHGVEEANKARMATQALFNGSTSTDHVPSATLSLSALKAGLPLTTILCESKLCSSKSEARRLIEQGGASVNDTKISDVNFIVTVDALTDHSLMLKAGKKKFLKVIFN